MIRFSARFDVDVANELDFLATLYNASKNEVLNSLIRAEYNRHESDPKIQLAIEQMNILKETLSEMDTKLKAISDR